VKNNRLNASELNLETNPSPVTPMVGMPVIIRKRAGRGYSVHCRVVSTTQVTTTLNALYLSAPNLNAALNQDPRNPDIAAERFLQVLQRKPFDVPVTSLFATEDC
jgi:hypothetical protein